MWFIIFFFPCVFGDRLKVDQAFRDSNFSFDIFLTEQCMIALVVPSMNFF